MQHTRFSRVPVPRDPREYSHRGWPSASRSPSRRAERRVPRRNSRTPVRPHGFVAIGHDPRTELFAGQLDLDDEGYLKVEAPSTRTNIAGVFGAGRRRRPHLLPSHHRRWLRLCRGPGRRALTRSSHRQRGGRGAREDTGNSLNATAKRVLPARPHPRGSYLYGRTCEAGPMPRRGRGSVPGRGARVSRARPRHRPDEADHQV